MLPHCRLTGPEGLDATEDLHIWTEEPRRRRVPRLSAKHRLAVLVVSAILLAERGPVGAYAPEYGGCNLRSRAGDADVAALVMTRPRFEVAARVREAVLVFEPRRTPGDWSEQRVAHSEAAHEKRNQRIPVVTV